MDTAVSPPKRSSSMFMKMDVIRAATLLRKLGAPHEIVRRIMDRLNLGRQNFRHSFLAKNGTNAATAHTIMPSAVPSAAAHMPHLHTNRKRNSSPTHSTDMATFMTRLPLITPQTRR